ncbi:MAG: sulfatase-like hydrolase/transferase [Bacteroidota bacterium]
MTTLKYLLSLLAVLSLTCTACQPSPAPAAPVPLSPSSMKYGEANVPQKNADRPNVLLLIADDLGWADLNCYGSHLTQTDNLDALARDGVQFMQAYAAAATGTPARAALQTGLARHSRILSVLDFPLLVESQEEASFGWAHGTLVYQLSTLSMSLFQFQLME